MKAVLYTLDLRGPCEEKECTYTVIAVEKTKACVSEYMARCLSAQEIFSNPYAYSNKMCWELLTFHRANLSAEDEEGKYLSRTGITTEWYSTIDELFEEISRLIVKNGVEVNSVEDVLNSGEDSPAGNKYVWLATYDSKSGTEELIERD